MDTSAQSTRVTITVVLIGALVAGAMVLLLGTAGSVPSAAAAEACGGSGGGGGGGTPTPSGSPSPSPSDSGGGLPTDILTNLPGDNESSASPTGSPSGSPTAGGGTTQKCATKLTIAYDKGAFHGAVKSDARECKSGRTVKVYLEKGRRDKVVGTTVSTRRGTWREPYKAKGEKYYAKTGKATKVATNGDKIVCGPATSKTIKAGS